MIKELMIRTIIFDLDGTLVDSKNDIAHSVNRTLVRFNLPVKKLEEIYTMIGEGVYRLISQALTGHEEKVELGVETFRAYYRENLLDTTVCYPGIYEVLDRIGDRFLAVITNKPKEFTIPILNGLGLLHRFDLIISGDEKWPKKPVPDSIYEVMKRSSSSGSETLSIGDHYTDILAGKNAGILTCWASYGFGQKRDLVPDLTINKPLDILECVK
jgi:phosphoglycolate phosphatase